MSEYNLSYTGAEVNELLSTVSDNHGAWDSISQTNHIVAEGTSGEWTYRKWSNGVAECWLSKTWTSDDGFFAWGNVYVCSEGDALIPRSYPFEFVDYPVVSASYGNVDENAYTIATTIESITKTKSPVVRGLRASAIASGTSLTFQATIYAIGRWKQNRLAFYIPVC